MGANYSKSKEDKLRTDRLYESDPSIYKKQNQIATHVPKISGLFSNHTPCQTPFNRRYFQSDQSKSQLINYKSQAFRADPGFRALSLQTPSLIGLNPVYGQQSIEPPPRKDYATPKSYETFRISYHEANIKDDDLKIYRQRIEENATRKQMEEQQDIAQAAKLKRIEERSKAITQREPQKPVLSLHSFMGIKDRLLSIRLQDRKYFPLGKFPELTPAMQVEIEDALKPYPSDDIIVELDGVQILRKDIQTLRGLNWLNDEIMNAYMNLLVLRGKNARRSVYAFNTFFYPKLRNSGYSAVKRWTRKVDIFSHDHILIPVHLGNHWCLAFINFMNRTISYFDSMGGHSNGCCDILLEYLKQESLDKKKQELGDENWRLIDRSSEIPRQDNCSDCGVFACTYAEYLTRPAKFNFEQKDMPYFRKKMAYEIVKKKILSC